jgi:hypothetical protein
MLYKLEDSKKDVGIISTFDPLPYILQSTKIEVLVAA